MPHSGRNSSRIPYEFIQRNIGRVWDGSEARPASTGATPGGSQKCSTPATRPRQSADHHAVERSGGLKGHDKVAQGKASRREPQSAALGGENSRNPRPEGARQRAAVRCRAPSGLGIFVEPIPRAALAPDDIVAAPFGAKFIVDPARWSNQTSNGLDGSACTAHINRRYAGGSRKRSPPATRPRRWHW